MRSSSTFNAVKVFSATMLAQRQQLGELVSDWLTRHPQIDIVDVRVSQSSDDRFHCLSIIVFYREHEQR
jgi:hypothetical protein